MHVRFINDLLKGICCKYLLTCSMTFFREINPQVFKCNSVGGNKHHDEKTNNETTTSKRRIILNNIFRVLKQQVNVGLTNNGG